MSRPVVLVTGSAVAQEARALLSEAGLDAVFMGASIDEGSLLSAVSRRAVAAILLRGRAPLTPRVFTAAKSLKIVSKHGTGLDSVDVAGATAHGIAIMIAKGVNAGAVAEHALALMLALARELPRFDRGLRKGAWKDQRYLVQGFKSRVVGIVGYGEVGRATAALAAACGAKVVIHSRSWSEPPPGMEWEPDLERLLARVDVVSLHCRLTEETRGLIGARQLALMRPDALLINTARGQLVDEPALTAALKEGRLAGAGLDTFAAEPPDLANELFALPNVLCTPHIASSTAETAARVGAVAAQNIISFLRGEVYDPRNFINPEVIKRA